MNQQQKNYTIKRLDTIATKKIVNSKSDCTTEGLSLESSEKWMLGLAGKVSRIKKYKPSGSYNHPDQIWNFSHLEKDSFFDEKKYNSYKKKINKKCQALKDEIMLGNADEALKAIKDFEAM